MLVGPVAGDNRTMSQEDVQAVTRMFDAFNRGDFEAALALLHEDVIWQDPPDAPDGNGPYRGHDAVSAEFARFLSAWESLRMELEEVIDAGHCVVVVTRWVGRGRDSGVPVDRRTAQLYEFHDGRVVRLRQFAEREDALLAAGLAG